jgi:DNA-3-methyladenine glycosylase II
MKNHSKDINRGIAHLSAVCKPLAKIAAQSQKFNLYPQPASVNSYFESLVRSVIAQQISSQAANTIFERLHKATRKNLTPRTIFSRSEAELRSIGLSGGKTKTIKALAQYQLDKEIDLALVPDLPDEEIVKMLTKIWGIGQWTAEMFLMFSLGRLNVWPVGDLAVRKGWQAAHKLAFTPNEKEMLPLGSNFAPYRSIAAWYCWRVFEPVEPW